MKWRITFLEVGWLCLCDVGTGKSPLHEDFHDGMCMLDWSFAFWVASRKEFQAMAWGAVGRRFRMDDDVSITLVA
jgi:hypothetical protein